MSLTRASYMDLEQRSDLWFELRCGLVTASVVGQLITTKTLGATDFDCPACSAPADSPCVSKVKRNGETGAAIKTVHPERAAYAAEVTKGTPPLLVPADTDYSRSVTAALVAERISGVVEETPMTSDMWRGIDEEPRARDRYAETYADGAPVKTCGLMTLDGPGWSLGYSPDALVGDEGLLEVKAPRQKGYLQAVLSDAVPERYVAQCQTALLVSGREWLDFVPFHGGLPLWRKRVYPDPRWQEAIVAAVQAFEQTAAEMVANFNQATDGLPETERIDYNNLGLVF